ncbi:MAG: transglycosylase domain-containing protein [Clostridia bacterium]|nr:transglycosylase domain-containing protein [Clostridia bacterium]
MGKTARNRTKKALFWAFLLIITAVLAVGTFFAVRGYSMYRTALEEQPLAEKVAEIQGRASYVTLKELPPIYHDALLAAEDHRYYSHNGIDPIGILRALWVDLTTLSLKEGGSTITQQLAKNLYFPMDQSPERKIAEMLLAVRLEKEYGKEGVLDLYINSIYYGSGYYCIYDAAKGYFDKEPGALSDFECTLLVGIPNAPSVYDPTVNPDLAEQRHKQVLDKMVRNGYLTQEEAEAIKYEENS